MNEIQFYTNYRAKNCLLFHRLAKLANCTQKKKTLSVKDKRNEVTSVTPAGRNKA